MTITTEPIGSVPRPLALIDAIKTKGATDDCGFPPFCDDISTNRDTALAKIRARVPGTALAAKLIGGG